MPSVSETDQNSKIIESDNRNRENAAGVESISGIERKNIKQVSDIDQLTAFLGEVMPGAENDVEEFKKFIYLHVRNYIEMGYILNIEKDGTTPHVDTFQSDLNAEKLELLMKDKRQFCLDEIKLIGQESAYDGEGRTAYQLDMANEQDGQSLVDVYKYDVIDDLKIRSILSKDTKSVFHISDPKQRNTMIREYREDHSPITDQQIYGKLVEMSADYQVRFAENGYVAAPDPDQEKVTRDYNDNDFSDILGAGSASQEKPVEDLNEGKIVNFSKYGNKPIEQFSEEEISDIIQEFRRNNELYVNRDLAGSATINMESIFNSIIEDINVDRAHLEAIIKDCKTIYGDTWVQDQLDKLDEQFSEQQAESPESVEVLPANDESDQPSQNVRNLARRALDKLKIW